MTIVPEGAQLSEDGQWWWDGHAWQAVGSGSGGADGGAPQATAEFAFDTNGVMVSPDDTDNPDGHVVLHHDAGTQVSFLIWNLGQAAGVATVTVYVDEQQVETWTSGEIPPGGAQSPGDGFVHGCGRHPAGRHVFRVLVSPGYAGHDEAINAVDVD